MREDLEQIRQVADEACALTRRLLTEGCRALGLTCDRVASSDDPGTADELVAEAAHSLNTSLTLIMGYCEFLLDGLSTCSSMYLDLREIARAADYASSLTRLLLAISYETAYRPRPVNPNDLIISMQGVIRCLLGRDIDFVTVLDPAPGEVYVDPRQIERAILNLVTNARDAMPNGGKLAILTSTVGSLPSELAVPQADERREYVVLSTSDTGCGMDTETQARLFEPFFTTKADGEGTGLGLYIVHEIVSGAGGYIQVYSQPGCGTAFHVYLPRMA
jgi:signal transduction histidine kinase